MALKRTNVYADEEDLALIKAEAARQGISEAEIIREAIHRAALASRIWDEPAFTDDDLIPLGSAVTHDDIKAIRRESADRAARETAR